jgi:hypothetical protein
MQIVIKPGGIVVVTIALSLIMLMLIPSRKHNAPLILHAGSVASYPFDEGKGATAADATGNRHPLMLRGEAGWNSGYAGSSLALSGNNGYADCPVPLVDTSKSYTVTACVKLNTLTGFQTFVSIDGERVSGFYLQLRDDNHRLSFAVLPNDDDTKNTPAMAIAHELPVAGRWYHLTGVYDASDRMVSLYVNGKLHQKTPCESVWKASGHTVIGRGKFGGEPRDFVHGQIDQVAIYPRALTAEEIDTLAQATIQAQRRQS